MSFLLVFFIFPLTICIVCFIITEKITKGRCGQTGYAVIIIVVSVLQIAVSYYYPVLEYKNIYLVPFVLLALFCVNVHFSTKRYNDAVTDKYEKYLVYLSPVSTSILFLGYLVTHFESYINEPRIIFLLLLIGANVIPVTILCLKKSDIDIKNNDVPINYRSVLNELYLDKIVNLISINDDSICINNFEYSIKHYQNRHIIASNKYIDNENLLAKFLKEKDIQKFGSHYKNMYFELTDDEYSSMIAEIKNMKNVIFIDYPFLVINNVNIFIRKYGTKYSVILLKPDKEKLNNEIIELEKISKKRENEKYVCYENIKKENIVLWMKNRA